MRLRGLWLTALLLIGLAVLGAANVAPTMQDQYIATVQDDPVTFEIRAEDMDIDPADATSHPLVFSIVAGPMHGVLVGDLTIITYRPPHTAAVEMTYIPADGYVGSDYITLSVTDPLGEQAVGTMTVEIEIEARRSLGILSGNWGSGVTYNTQTSGFTAFRTQFTGVYRIGSLTMKSIASIQMETVSGDKRMVFESLRFQSDFTVAGIDHTSTLSFDPDAGGADLFDYWQTSTRFSLGVANFTHSLYLPNSQTDSYQALSVQARIGSVSITNNLTLSMNPSCGFDFSNNQTSVAWSMCDVAVRAAIGFNCDGFDKFTLSASGISISGFGWLLGDVYIDASLTFDMDGKSLSASTYWRPGAVNCIKLLAELDLSGPAAGPVSGNTVFESIHIYGLKLECDIPSVYGNVRFVSATSFGSSYNSTVTGQTDYFEMFRFSGTVLSCCGYPGSWSTATYFNTGSAMLFDWGMTIIRADVVLSDHFNFSFETVFRSGIFGDPKLELSVGWMTRW